MDSQREEYMALHKLVNGKKVELTPEEEASIRAEWEEGAKKAEEKKRQLALKKEKQQLAIEKLLKDLNEEEKAIIKELLRA